MPIELTQREREAVAEAQIAIFEDRIILQAQPPVTDEALHAVAAHCAGPLPSELTALWHTAFGGSLDYSLRCDLEGRDVPLAFREIFYPESGHYHDIWGWIAHEEELAQDVAQERGREWSGVLEALPLGGFEYLERVYVITSSDEHGCVWGWKQGIPGWCFESHDDLAGRIADDLRALFRSLVLEEDPYAEDCDVNIAGAEMRDAIERIGLRSAADALRAVVRSTVLDWRAALEKRTIAQERRMRRLALAQAANQDDVELLARLATADCDLGEDVGSGLTALDVALGRGSMRAVRWLLDRGLSSEHALIAGAATVDFDLAKELLGRGARVDANAVFTALDAGKADVAMLLSKAPSLTLRARELAVRARERARRDEQRAARIESGKVLSNVSAEEYRARAASLREMAERLDPPLRKT